MNAYEVQIDPAFGIRPQIAYVVAKTMAEACEDAEQSVPKGSIIEHVRLLGPVLGDAECVCTALCCQDHKG